MVAPAAMADTLLVDRGLPTANLNNAAGADRSNVGWGYANYDNWFTGDDFTLAAVDGQWRIDTIRTWAYAGDLRP